MSGVTNRVPFEEAADLLSSARACVAFVVDGEPRVEPAIVRYDDSRFIVATDDRSVDAPDVTEAVLVVDDGLLFFDLRAVYVRGTPVSLGESPDGGRVWFELDPTTVSCWDYGRLRASDGPD